MKNRRQKEDWKPLKKYPQFKRVKFHRRRHSDEILAHMMLFTKAGKEIFPNLDPNNIEYSTDNKCNYRDNPEVLHIGCGNDPIFDEHSMKNNHWESACTLMAKALGLLHHPAWKKTIENVRREDREGKAIVGEIAWLVKSLYRSHGGNIEAEEEVAKWAETAYWAEIDSAMENSSYRSGKPLTTKTAVALLVKQDYLEIEWFRKMIAETLEYEKWSRDVARETFLRDGICFVVDSEFSQLKVFTINSDNEGVASICWSFGADIVVIRKSNGHTAIMTNYSRKEKLSLMKVWNDLKSLETPKGVDWICVGEGCPLLLNGSKTHPDVVPSSLSLEEIARVIAYGVGNGFAYESMNYESLEAELKKVCCRK